MAALWTTPVVVFGWKVSRTSYPRGTEWWPDVIFMSLQDAEFTSLECKGGNSGWWHIVRCYTTIRQSRQVDIFGVSARDVAIFVPWDPMDHLVTTSKHCSGKLAVNWGKRANAVISINYTHNKDGKAGEEVLLKDSPLTRTHLRTDSNTLVLDNFWTPRWDNS